MPEELPMPPLLVPPPVPSAPTLPKLTAEMVATAKERGLPPVAGGGWAPKQHTPIWIGLTAAVCASLGPVLMTLPIPTPWGGVSAALVMAIGAGFGTYLATLSAGPRKVRP